LTIPVACIGLGRIAYALEEDQYRYHPCTHLGSVLARRAFRLTHALDHSEKRCLKFAHWWQKNSGRTMPELHFEARPFFEELRNNPPSACIIATPPASHVDLALAVLDAGVRQIVLEKPISLHLGQAQQLLGAAKKKKARIRVNFERRYHNGYRKIQTLIESEQLGVLRSVQGKVLRGPIRHGEGAGMEGPLLHDAIHWLDLLLYYAGKPHNVFYRRMDLSSRPPLEHTVFMRFDYPNFSAVLESGGRRRYFTFEMELDFERGRIRAGNTGFELFLSRPSRRYAQFFELKPARFAFRPNNPWLDLYRELERDCRGQSTANSSSLESAMESLAIVDQVYRML